VGFRFFVFLLFLKNFLSLLYAKWNEQIPDSVYECLHPGVRKAFLDHDERGVWSANAYLPNRWRWRMEMIYV